MVQSGREMGEECRELADLYSLGLLGEIDRDRFEGHLERCGGCQRTLAANRTALAALGPNVVPPGLAREWVLDLARAPRLPIDLRARAWEEIAPGVRLHVFNDDESRFVRSQLMWAQPGAVRPSHRHLGEEAILVLQGGLIVSGSTYNSGDICRVRAGSLHSEQSAGQGECVCFVVHRPSMASTRAVDGAGDEACVRCRFYSEHRAAFHPLVMRPSPA
jgi:anti-sigma factor ChrR (cupin superfamily)